MPQWVKHWSGTEMTSLIPNQGMTFSIMHFDVEAHWRLELILQKNGFASSYMTFLKIGSVVKIWCISDLP